MKIEAVLFDLDGTLFDTDDVWLDGLLSRLGGWSRAPVWSRPARAALTWGEGIASRLLALLDGVDLDDDVDRLAARLLARRLRSTGVQRPVAGVPGMLADLAMRYPLAVVTTRSHRGAQVLLDGAALTPHFRAIVARDDTRRIKPHPEPVQRAAAELGVSPAACLMVGDTTADVLSAKAAGAWAVGVLCGFGREADLRRAGADQILPGTVDLCGLLRCTRR